MQRPRHSASLSTNAYVLSITALPDCYAAAASSPADTIHLFAKRDLRRLTTLQGHPGGTSSIRSVNLHATSNGSGQTLASCGKDGFDISLDGLTIATGTVLNGEDASIHYWDVRKPTIPIFSHTSTHSDDITSLHFHPTLPDRLLSASTDGLLSVTNTTEEDEDEAVEHVGNWGCSIAQAGWHHDGIWAASDMETFSLWTPELDKVSEPNFKEIAPRPQHSWEPNYLIGCHKSQDRLIPIVGSNSGSFSFLSPPTQPWIVDRTWPSHHDGIVRSLLVDDVLGCLVTGGEDGALHLWDMNTSNTASSPSESGRKRQFHRERETDEMDVDHAQQPKKPKRR